jgi:L-histidine Nalpha-methyltransferase
MIAEMSGATTVIELGSGTSDKTRTLLDAFVAHGEIERFVPLDVSEATLVYAAEVLDQRYPDLVVEPVVGDFTRHLSRLPTGGTRLVAFLGGTIGNFYLEERRAFLGALCRRTRAGRLAAARPRPRQADRPDHGAYDDREGVTDAFIRNSLHVINRELDADFDVGNFDYVPLWDAANIASTCACGRASPRSAHIGALGLDVVFEAGEELRVEISTKFRSLRSRRRTRRRRLRRHRVPHRRAGDFALALTRRR